jgi:hypothetical protein
MKKFYTSAFVLLTLVLFGCSKDFLKSYDERIVGTWRITNVDKFGFGGSTANLPFREGTFSFMSDGTMTFTNSSGNVFKGTWDIRKKVVGEGDDSEVYHSLQITAVNFASQQVIGEYYDDINFAGTNHIKARVFSGAHTYITHLRR